MGQKDKPLAWLHGAVKTPPFIYRVDTDAIVIADVFVKKTAQTPQGVLEACRKRLKEYDDASK